MHDSLSNKALVCHDMSDIVTYSSKINIVWLGEESSKVILKNNTTI